MKFRYSLVGIALAILSIPVLAAPVQAAEPDTSQLIQQLQTGGEEAYAAADELAFAPADQAVPALIKSLSQEDVELQRRAARSLARFGSQAQAAIPELRKMLDAPVPKVRAYAAYALGEIGDARPETVSRLIEMIADEDAVVRRTALEALLELDTDPEQTFPALAHVLETADPQLILPVLSELADAGKGALPQLKRALGTEQGAYWAALIASEMGKDAAPVVPELTAALKHPDEATRMHVLIALGEIGPEAKPARDEVVEVLRTSTVPALQYSAAFALAAMEDPQATEALQKVAEGDDAFLSLMAYYAVAKLNPEDKEKAKTAATFLAESMKNENINIRAAAARGLANLNIAPEILEPILGEALKSADPLVVAHMEDAIVRMGPQAVPEVGQMLQNKEMRWSALAIIRRWGEAAPEITKPLQEALKAEDDPNFQAEVLLALGAVGSKAAGALEEIRPFLKSDSRELKLNAVYALGKIGPGALSAQEEVTALLASDDAFTRFAAAWALAHISPEDKDVAARAVPVLTETVANAGEGFASHEAAKALAMFGERAKSSIPQLREAAADGNEAAAEALEFLKD